MSRARSSAVGAAAALLALPLGGCLSFHSDQLAPQAYALSLAPRPDAGAASAVTRPSFRPGSASGATTGEDDSVQVQLPMASPGLGGESIAVARPGLLRDYYNGAHWAVTAPAMLQTLAIEALRRQGNFSLVESGTGPFPAQYTLWLELTHFEADYADSGPPTVRVALICTLLSRATRGVIASFTAESAVRADADRMQAVVAAFEQATDEALAQLAAHAVAPAVPPTVPGSPSAP